MTFLDISKKVDARGERGLLGVAFDPDFANNSYVYVYYTRKATRKTPAHNRVVRFTANGDQVVPGSEKLLLRLNRLSDAQNHNGGAIHFGEDGELYIAVGENARPSAAQSLGNLLGKMLRIKRTVRSPKTTHSIRRPRATIRPSGPEACATPSASRSSQAQAASS